MACLSNSASLLALALFSLSACSGETFSARDEASAGETGQAGDRAGGGTGGSGEGGSGAQASAGVGGSAQEGSAPLSSGGAAGQGPSGGRGGADPSGGGVSAGTSGSGGDGGLASPGAGGIPNGMGGSLEAGAPSAGSGGAGASGNGGSAGSGEFVGACGRQLLHNGDFDQGPSPEWREESTWSSGLEIIVARDYPALAAEMVTPDSGNYLAWLGGIPDNQFDHHLVILEQDVAIPEEAASLTFSGKFRVKTEEDNSYPADESYLEFSYEDAVVWQVKHLTNLDSELGDGWQDFSVSGSELENLRGRTLTLVAYSRTDPMLKTSFWIDSLRLVATCDR